MHAANNIVGFPSQWLINVNKSLCQLSDGCSESLVRNFELIGISSSKVTPYLDGTCGGMLMTTS